MGTRFYKGLGKGSGKTKFSNDLFRMTGDSLAERGSELPGVLSRELGGAEIRSPVLENLKASARHSAAQVFPILCDPPLPALCLNLAHLRRPLWDHKFAFSL